MTMFEKVKEYYIKELWSIDRVWNVVGKVITEDEYFQITSFIYPEKSS